MFWLWASLALQLASAPWLTQATGASSLPDGVISVPLHRIKNQTAYGVELHVGNPPQRVVVLADSGSPTYAVESPRNPTCKQGLCKAYGTYDNTTSKTTKWISSGYNDDIIDHGLGSFVNDTIRVAGKTFPNMNFGVVEQYAASFPITTPQAAIFGLGGICTTKACDAYPGFLQQLYDRDAIAKRAYSVYLGPNDPDATGQLVFGGIDRAKMCGSGFKVPMMDPTTNAANNSPNWVRTMSLELRLSNGTATKHDFPGKGAATIVDTGSPHWYMPTKFFHQVAAALGLPKHVDTSGTWVEVDCAYRKPTKDVLVVGFGEGAEIEIALHRLVGKLGDKCVTGILPGGSSLGDPFLRGAYVTFDIDDLTLEMSPVKYTGETDIVKIK